MTEFTLASGQAVAEQGIKHSEAMYAETHNPVFAWDAISQALHAGLPLPQWVLTYLLTAAGEFYHLSRTRIPRKGQIDRAVSRALGFSTAGRVNHFSAMSKETHEIQIVFAVYDCETQDWQARRTRPARPLVDLYKEAAITHANTCELCTRPYSVGKVEKLWLKWQHAFPQRTKRDAKQRGARIKERRDQQDAAQTEAKLAALDKAKRRNQHWRG